MTLPDSASGTVLVVDGANVVGSRPDGWWHDRAGAALRLHAELAATALPYDAVVLVVEGAARQGPAADEAGRLRTVHAEGSGDDAIVTLVHALAGEGRAVVVVTADRGLRRRVEGEGVSCRGPGWLREQL